MRPRRSRSRTSTSAATSPPRWRPDRRAEPRSWPRRTRGSWWASTVRERSSSPSSERARADKRQVTYMVRTHPRARPRSDTRPRRGRSGRRDLSREPPGRARARARGARGGGGRPMIAFLTGRVAAKAPGFALVEVGGVGYRLLMATSSLSALPGRRRRGHRAHLPARPRGRAHLYGFENEDERIALRVAHRRDRRRAQGRARRAVRAPGRTPCGRASRATTWR